MRVIAVAVVIVIVMGLLIALQQVEVVRLQGDLAIEAKSKAEAVAANAESQATITTLRAEAKRNADYQADLARRLKASETKARQARKDFEELKRNSKPVRDWAAQPLPDGLRGKAGGGQDQHRTN
ncbi:hypothetical protein RRX38_02775 [Pseudomonas sp. DTU_2021_1001937_2_SI_NGA_ILE_001]|uniref:hypothetical protein n=1 Tax=Pseudomonas sp. DTU_2021_1001937_2_SI_NGA_ILE_001 TaxID=3077589 RepID=UPI0028FC1C15|nr:hypothetical protein [Pseudomonas sp. DTU_2021_1001937_2_SI_NGA_ILE_001]WNW14208.1 hypothetical protein RRX38_02775 [Pseudomonas sp. DTU_2021_1001937_2_SI_NGA_ILE_001]